MKLLHILWRKLQPLRNPVEPAFNVPNARTEQLTEKTVEFLAEQDGVPERELKKRLAANFTDMSEVRKAFLTLVNYRGSGRHVALCIIGDHDKAPAIASKAGAVFHAMFAPEMHIDIMLLSSEQEKRIEQVCQPFFVR